MFLIDPPLRALAQLDDPVFLGVLWRSLAWTVVAFLALGAGLVWGAESLAAGHGWLAWITGVIGGLGAAVLTLYFFLPVATVIATLFSDRIAAAVERRFYPWLPPTAPASLIDQTWDGLALGLRVLVLQVLALLLSLTPLAPVAAPLGWLIAAWAVGRGVFVAVAMRRMSRAQATSLYRARRGAVVAQGALIALASWVPLLNLLVPVLGTAALVHVLHSDERPTLFRPRQTIA
jgi:CysZ protein